LVKSQKEIKKKIVCQDIERNVKKINPQIVYNFHFGSTN